MAQVKFYGMNLDFQFVRDYYNKSDFSQFIFQAYMPNSGASEEEYFLQVYAMNDMGVVLERKELMVVPDDSYNAPQRLDMGNISMNRLQLEPYIQADRITPFANLYLSPRPYEQFYVAYFVEGTFTGDARAEATARTAGVSSEIKPSPPAPPEV